MTDQTQYEWRAYTIITPTEQSISRSINGNKSPYRSPYRSFIDESNVRHYSFDTTKREWLLVYKREIGTSFQEPCW